MDIDNIRFDNRMLGMLLSTLPDLKLLSFNAAYGRESANLPQVITSSSTYKLKQLYLCRR